jgi:hypothetical protein
MGHQVCSVASAGTILDEAMAFRPDVALLDWAIPEARQVCDCLTLSGARLVAVGAPAEARRLQECPEAVLYGFLAAPCTRTELSRVLASAEQDVFDYRDAERDDFEVRKLMALAGRRHAYLANMVVFRLVGGARDGLELYGDRAARLYIAMDEDPLYCTFFACRRRLVRRRTWAPLRCRFIKIKERHRYVVESITNSPDRILLIARPVTPDDELVEDYRPYPDYE